MAVGTGSDRPQGLVSDAAEGYVDAQYRPLSLTNDGRLRSAVVLEVTWMDLFGDVPGVSDDDFPRCTGSSLFFGT